MMGGFYRGADFRDRGRFSEPVEQSDGLGNTILGHRFAGFRWVDLVVKSARELSEAGAPHDTAAATMRVREDSFTRRVTSKWVIEARGQQWSVTGITPVGRKGRVLEFSVESGVSK